MDAAHLHLLLNHFPIVGLMVVLVAFLWALLKNNSSLLTFSLWAFAALAVITIPLDQTGEAAEEVVEKRANINEAYIEEHEAAAEWAGPLMYITGSLALLGLFFNRKPTGIPAWLKTILVILALMTQTAMIRTGLLGGKIIRPELQTETFAPSGAEEEND